MPHVKKAILFALASRANDGGECWPSLRKLCSDSGLARRTVQINLQQLIEAGLVGRTARPGRSAILRIDVCSGCTGAPHAPVYAVREGSASDAPHSRTRDTSPVHGMHPKLKGRFSIKGL